MSRNPELALLLESFDRNGRVNDIILSTLTETDLALEDGQGGWNIGQHLGHLAEFRYGWLNFISPQHAENIPSVTESDQQSFQLTTQNPADLKQALTAGDAAALEAVMSALNENRSFEGAYKSHPAHFLPHHCPRFASPRPGNEPSAAKRLDA